MARLTRVVVPGVPHHVTQRGNRRLATKVYYQKNPLFSSKGLIPTFPTFRE